MNNPKLLIADDSDAKQLMLEGFVRHNHWKVEILTAASTDEAKKSATTGRAGSFRESP